MAVQKLEVEEVGYFEEALSDFVQDFAYGDAIRHLADKGYTPERIIRDFDYPLSEEKIRKIVERHLKEKEKGGK